MTAGQPTRAGFLRRLRSVSCLLQPRSYVNVLFHRCSTDLEQSSIKGTRRHRQTRSGGVAPMGPHSEERRPGSTEENNGRVPEWVGRIGDRTPERSRGDRDGAPEQCIPLDAVRCWLTGYLRMVPTVFVRQGRRRDIDRASTPFARARRIAALVSSSSFRPVRSVRSKRSSAIESFVVIRAE